MTGRLFDVLRECIHVTLLRWVKGHPLSGTDENRLQRMSSPFTLFDGPPNRLRPAFKTYTLSSATMVYSPSHSILMDGQGFPFLATQIRNLVSRRAHPPGGKSPHKSGHASVPEVNINVTCARRVFITYARRAPSSFRVCTVISTGTLGDIYPEHIYTRPYALPTTTLRHVRRSTMVQ